MSGRRHADQNTLIEVANVAEPAAAGNAISGAESPSGLLSPKVPVTQDFNKVCICTDSA